MSSEHRSGRRPSAREKHERGLTRKGRDAGGEKADDRRFPPSKRPDGFKGPWPPKED